jgi:pyruvate/oxaloacetate carboxyltransferase
MTTSTAFALPSFPGAEKFTPEAIQANLRPVMEQMQAWADLGKKHFEESRLATEAALKSMTGIKDPQAAVELIKANATQGLALVGEQLRASAELGVAQFHAALDATAAKLPSPEAFAPLTKGLKTGIDTVHSSLTSVIDQVAPTTAKKTTRRG